MDRKFKPISSKESKSWMFLFCKILNFWCYPNPIMIAPDPIYATAPLIIFVTILKFRHVVYHMIQSLFRTFRNLIRIMKFSKIAWTKTPLFDSLVDVYVRFMFSWWIFRYHTGWLPHRVLFWALSLFIVGLW